MTEQKSQLRSTMIRRREALTAADCQLAAAGLRTTLPALLAAIKPRLAPGAPLRLGVYCAIRQEADLSPACADLQSAGGFELYYPAVKGSSEAAELVFGCLPMDCEPADFLARGCFGIAEPKSTCWLPELPTLDVVLLPGLAFDRAGNRLGWGRGFYDRLIPKLSGNPVLVGVCYDFQIVAGQLPITAGDRPVDWLLTPEGFHMIKCN